MYIASCPVNGDVCLDPNLDCCMRILRLLAIKRDYLAENLVNILREVDRG